MKRITKKWLACLAVATLLAACSEQDEGADLAPDLQREEQEQPIEEVTATLYEAPFTGIQSEEKITQRPVLVTINNHPLARPQSGISEADIVYELVAEGNVTRLLALFQSELPEEMGPVRSARDYFVEIANGLDAFYVAHGYSPDAKELLQSHVIDNVNGMQYDGTLFKRSAERKAPHNSYITGDNVLEAAEITNSSMEMKKNPSLSFHESIESAKIGDSASTINVRYGSNPDFFSTYSFDAEKGTYDRTVNGVLTIDKGNEQQVELSNVLVFETAHRVIDGEGRQAVDIKSGGEALLFQGGVAKAIEWQNIDGMMVPVENGVPVKLVPGKTWIHIVSTDPGMEASVTFTP